MSVEASGVDENFRGEEAVDFVFGERGVVENFLTFLVVLSLPAFEEAIFVGENERDVAGLENRIVVFVDEPDILSVAGVAVGQEFMTVDELNEIFLLEDFDARNVFEKSLTGIVVVEEECQKIIVGEGSGFGNFVVK